jgi:hypothetical protein
LLEGDNSIIEAVRNGELGSINVPEDEVHA